MDANELGRWTRFAAKGGIGKCTAIQDCVAEEAEDLMFLKDDEITVLMQLPGQDDVYLGHCEGVVGRFKGSFVQFHSRLKKPVLTKRSSSALLGGSISRPSSSQSAITVAVRDSISPFPSSASPVPSTIRSPGLTHSVSASASISSDASLVHAIPRSSISSPASSPRRPPSSLKEVALDRRSVIDANVAVEPNHTLRAPSDTAASEDETPAEVVVPVADVVRPSSVVEPPRSSLESKNEDQHSEDDVLPQASEKCLTAASGTDTDSVRSTYLDPSFDDSEPSTRISIALSDGEVGIGLSLLQDFVGGGDDDAASTYSRAQTPETGPASDAAIARDSPDSTVEDHTTRSLRSARSESQYSSSSRGADVTPSHSRTSPLNYRERERTSMISVHPSVADSSDFGGEEWEGASDIYDNYRYSRFSMASKVSRFSKGSMHTLASGFGVPPVPAEFQSSTSDQRSVEVNTDRMVADSPRRPSVESRPSSDQAKATSGTTDERGKRVPPPLKLSGMSQDAAHSRHDSLSPEGEQIASPLLHGTFGSPPPSATPHSTKSFPSAPLTSPMYPTTAGVASALRQRLELDRPLQPSSDLAPTESSEEQRHSGFNIVVDDDQQDPPSNVASPDMSLSSSMSIDTSFDLSNESRSTIAPITASTSEKSLLMMTPTPAEPAPPPYSPTAAEASSHANAAPGPSTQLRSPPMQATRRPVNPGAPPADPNARTSLFMPHPHAPKPTDSPAGPMYGRQPVPPAHLMPRPEGPPPGTILHSLNMVLTARREGRPGRTTIYGKFDRDLASSIGPVPISFTVDPPPPPVMAGPNGVKWHGVGANILRTGSPLSRQSSPLAAGEGSTAQPSPGTKQEPELVPRANFFPKSARPRSRSFSGFDKPIAEMFLPESQSHEDGSHPPLSPQRSKSATATPSAPVVLPAPQRATVSHSSSVVRALQAPSPLSLAQNNIVAAGPEADRAKLSGRATIHALPAPVKIVTRMQSLTQLSTMMASRDNGAMSEASSKTIHLNISSPTSPRSPPWTGQTGQSFSSAQSPAISPSLFPAVPTHLVAKHPNGVRAEPSSPIAPSPPADDDSPGSPPPPSVHSPASFTREFGDSLAPPPEVSSPTSPTLSVHASEYSQDQETVQVQDMDFELVKPTIPSSPMAASSSDSLSHRVVSPVPTTLDDASLLRAESPAPSMWSSTSARKPPLEQPHAAVGQPKRKPSEIEAHRQRELRWISTMSSVPPSQARKSKKIKKLVFEGVPASVRYLVWAHLTDSKGKRMDGLYRRLCEREKVTAHAEIERDIESCYSDQPELLDGSLLNLLQAYLCMVPDVNYSQGLTLIAGQLLLQSPEEDAFWTFTTLMDSHLRPYFASSLIQLDVDALLFGKALESNDAAVAKKTFVDLGITPVNVCKPWFLSAFASTLSADYLHRVWDVFLFEGVSFLFRVGLALFSCCRRSVLQCTSQDSLLATLHRPPANCLPASPDAFIELALSMKLKDEDVRKQRTKMEAQVKRQTQSRALTSINSSRAASISLPRN